MCIPPSRRLKEFHDILYPFIVWSRYVTRQPSRYQQRSLRTLFAQLISITHGRCTISMEGHHKPSETLYYQLVRGVTSYTYCATVLLIPCTSFRDDTVFQFTYTTLFGFHCAYLFVRSGSVLPPLFAHVFCNIMGVPQLQAELRWHPHRKTRT